MGSSWVLITMVWPPVIPPLRGNTAVIKTKIWCVNTGEHMIFGSIVGFDYYGLPYYVPVMPIVPPFYIQGKEGLGGRSVGWGLSLIHI